MAYTQATENKYIKCDLVFLKPFKSRAKAESVFEKTEEGTKVEWVMHGNVPFFLFFMKPKMQAWIGNDYERGLRILRDLCENNEILSTVRCLGVEVKNGFKFLGERKQTSIKNMPKEMGPAMVRVMKAVQEFGIEAGNQYFCQYHKMDFVSETVDFTCGEEINYWPENTDFITKTLPNVKCLVVRHTGAYRHLGNGWSFGYLYLRAHKIKPLSKVAPFEIYVNDPRTAEEKDLITDIYIPVC